KNLTLRIHPKNGQVWEALITVLRTFNNQQIEWFKAGSALNYMASQKKKIDDFDKLFSKINEI
ncbi:unnamed protein product, partial [Pneumocystis jirovecii]